MKKEKYKKIGIEAGVFMTVLFSIMIAVILLSANTTDVIIEREIRQKTLQPVPLADASHVDGDTLVMYVMAYPHQSVPATAYASNLSNATAYEFYDGLNNEMTGETPFSTAFDIVVKMGINITHGYNDSSAAWELTLHNATFKSSDLNFSSDVAGVEYSIDEAASWHFVHYVIQDADGGLGNGFQIGQGVKYNITDFEFWAFQ